MDDISYLKCLTANLHRELADMRLDRPMPTTMRWIADRLAAGARTAEKLAAAWDAEERAVAAA
jgi:hypothetical protein